jgi:hypothetical protein
MSLIQALLQVHQTLSDHYLLILISSMCSGLFESLSTCIDEKGVCLIGTGPKVALSNRNVLHLPPSIDGDAF